MPEANNGKRGTPGTRGPRGLGQPTGSGQPSPDLWGEVYLLYSSWLEHVYRAWQRTASSEQATFSTGPLSGSQ